MKTSLLGMFLGSQDSCFYETTSVLLDTKCDLLLSFPNCSWECKEEENNFYFLFEVPMYYEYQCTYEYFGDGCHYLRRLMEKSRA